MPRCQGAAESTSGICLRIAGSSLTSAPPPLSWRQIMLLASHHIVILLPFREKDLDRFFKGYGRKTDVLIKQVKTNSKHIFTVVLQGFGFVEFEDYRDADDAVYELNGKDLLGER